jgi:hypothetical protein
MRFTALVTEDGVLFDDHDELLAHLEPLLGQHISVDIHPRGETRSAAQLRWLKGVAIPRIAKKIGYDRHEYARLHDDLLSACFGTIAVPALLPGAPPRIMPAKRTSDMNVQEMSEYMEWVPRFAAEKLDCYVPMPDEPNPEPEDP